ncbi:hypothetical protein [Helicobacter pylori]|uniref:hypothetical protein n=1 Tax=Helicobacter pylori TaxID=210 RepID=UPI0039E0D036
MAVRFNNNNSEWMEEMQILFDKINNGSPFGVIREVFSFSPQLRQFLNNKCHFIGFVEIVIGPIESLFFVYENEPSTTFNLKNFLLVLAEYILHGKTIESFDNPTNYPPITLLPLQTPVEIEEHRKNTTFDQNYNSLHYRQSSTQNIKINSFINEINLTSAIIDKIEYHFRDNTFHFIFDVSNKFLSGKSRLTIEVPRVKLENIKLPDMKEIYVNQWYINIFINALIFSINEGSYTLTGV